MTIIEPPGRNPTEAQWQQTVVELAKLCGWLVYHTYDSRRSEPGFPDLVLVREQRLVFAELKTDRGRIRPEQQEWLERLHETGAEVYVWRPRDFELVHRRLRRHGHGGRLDGNRPGWPKGLARKDFDDLGPRAKARRQGRP